MKPLTISRLGIKLSFVNSYLFIGRVLPERLQVNIPKIIFNDLKSPEAPGERIGNLTVEAKNGQITANLITSQTFYLATIKNSVEFYVRLIVDSYGYNTGQAFDIDLEITSGPEGSYTFYPRINSIYKNQKDRPLPPEAVLTLASKNSSLLRALGNLREAIKHPIDVGLFCYRALESIRQHFVSENVSKAQSWTLLHTALNISAEFINNEPSLTAHSEQARHGETHNINDEDMEKMISKTWKIVDRFCIYLQNNETPIDKNLNPTL